MDVRPSEALTLAAITATPIRVEPAVSEIMAAHAAAEPTRPEGWLDTLEGASQIAADITARWPGYNMLRPKAPGEPAGGYPC